MPIKNERKRIQSLKTPLMQNRNDQADIVRNNVIEDLILKGKIQSIP